MSGIFRMDDDMRYGQKGFTLAPEVRALLSPYEEEEAEADDPDWGGVIHFDGLPWHEAEQLMKLLPEANRGDRQNAAPTFEQLIELGREFPEIRFHGYRVPSHRADERITFEGYFYPEGPQAHTLYERICEIAGEPDEYGPDAFRGQRVVRAWWD